MAHCYNPTCDHQPCGPDITITLEEADRVPVEGVSTIHTEADAVCCRLYGTCQTRCVERSEGEI